MRIANRLRDLRGTRSLKELAAESGISQGELSRIERGLLLPLDRQIPDLERVYGAAFPDWWLSPYATTAMERDEHEAAA